MRSPTALERMHNYSFKQFGSATVFINPARRAILSILSAKRGNSGITCRDEQASWDHFYSARRNNLETLETRKYHAHSIHKSLYLR